jgi:hypothetical protein
VLSTDGSAIAVTSPVNETITTGFFGLLYAVYMPTASVNAGDITVSECVSHEETALSDEGSHTFRSPYLLASKIVTLIKGRLSLYVLCLVPKIFNLKKHIFVLNAVFWDVAPCGSCKNRRFEGTDSPSSG